MAGLLREQTSDCANPVIDVVIRTTGGDLIDPFILEYIIFDVSTPSKQATPEQVFPASGRAAVNLSDCPTGQKLGTGHFVAVWTVPVDEDIGSHRIVWFFKKTALHAENTFQEEFEVLPPPSVGTPPGGFYCSLNDIRDLGLDVATASDLKVETAIRTASQIIDRITRQWFVPRSLTLKVDGNNSDTLHFGVPIISVEHLKLNDAATILDPISYAVYNANPYPDDRKNPRIKLKRESGNIYTTGGPFNTPIQFRKGRQNQEIKGVFGYVESDGAIPELIRKACLKLTIQYITMPVFVPSGTVPGAPPPPAPVGTVMKEITDGHTIQYTFVKFTDVRAGLSGITMDREILDILKIYRAPIGIAVPADWK